MQGGGGDGKKILYRVETKGLRISDDTAFKHARLPMHFDGDKEKRLKVEKKLS